jgi:YegS/Rv2252/BmrU family lipid kinase
MTKPPRSAALFVNAKSRKGQEAFEEACRLLAAAGIDLVRSKAIKDPSKLPGEVEQAVKAGVAMVIVGGGDGSISCAVDALVGSDTVFAILPLGTANSFARTLKIPLDIKSAVDAIAGGKVQRIDLGLIDKDYFANCAAIGIAPLIAETVPAKLKKWLGRPGYLAWAGLQMTRFRPFALTVKGEGVDETISALEVRIANGAYHGGAELVETDVRDGEIVVQAVIGTWRTKLLWSWGLSLLGPDQMRGTVREYRGKSFRLSTDRPLPISIDGEVLAETPVTVAVARKAIWMAVPA